MMIRPKKFKPIFLFAVLCLMCAPAPSGLAQFREALLFDEFGDIQASDLIARLDNFAIQLQNQPNAKGFLIVYRTRRDLPGLSNRFAHHMKSYLVNSRGLSPDRLVTVDGGAAPCLSQEVWIVPPGTAPKPRKDAYSNSYQPSVYKFDEHFYNLPRDPADISYWALPPEDLLGHLEAFAQTLQKDKSLTGFLVAFRGSNRDGAGVARGMLTKEKNFLVKEFGIKPSRIRTIDGGVRQWRAMELWIAEKGETIPSITTYRIRPSK